MKYKKVFRNIVIILSILVLLIDIFLYIKMKSTWAELNLSNEQYERASLMFVGLLRWGILIWGLLLVLIIWLEYFLTNLLVKICRKFNGFKKLILTLIIFSILIALLIFSIRIILIVVISLIR